MFATVISIFFWAIFPIGTAATAACLIAIHWRNWQLTQARWHLDHGPDEGPGYEVYRLSLASNRLAVIALVLGACLLVAVFAGIMGGTELKLAALAVSVGVALGSDNVRTRHARLEARFERQVGEPLARFHHKLNGVMTRV